LAVSPETDHAKKPPECKGVLICYFNDTEIILKIRLKFDILRIIESLKLFKH